MIIKNADDKQSSIAALQNLLTHPSASSTAKKNIEKELRNIKAGFKGESEAAYEMKVKYGDSLNWMIIHDLRIEHKDLVAQIDHLIINRFLEVWVCESKNFSEGITINEHGEFLAFYNRNPYGVASPIEQNNRHTLILKRLFDSGVVKLPTRLGFTIKPELKSLILISKGARITRPEKSIDGIESVIKNDQLAKTIEKALDDSRALSLAKAVSTATLEALARDIAALHKPINIDWNAKFGLPAQTVQPSSPVITPIAPSAQRPIPPPSDSLAPLPTKEEQKPKQKLICHSCTEPIPYNVAKFCWFNKSKFGGNIYCVECQKKVSSS